LKVGKHVIAVYLCSIMTIREYIWQRLSSLGFAPCDADIVDMGIDGSAELTEDNRDAAYRALVRFVPHMLLRPTSVSEGGAAVSRADRASIEAWYRMECKRLGIEDILSPRVKFI
jgi:hypothetical protein